ncbi:MAG: hypothetical protein WAU02_02855 [Candidatus Saccharimonadales bacterium]
MSNLPAHFDPVRWRSYSLFEQMGNIGSEVGRTFSALRRGDTTAAQTAFWRGLDLIDATAEILVAQKSPRLKELLRARESFAENYYAGHDNGLEQYFMHYAIAARYHC